MMRKRPLRVLQIGKYYPPVVGGMETHLHALCGELRKSVDLEVVVSGVQHRTTHTVVDGISVTGLGRIGEVASTPINFGLVRKIKESRADLLHLHHPNPIAVMAYLLSGFRGRLVITYHSDVVHQKNLKRLFEPFLRVALERSDAIIASSQNYIDSSDLLSQYQDRCRVIPFGIESARLERVDPRIVQSIRERYGPRIILAVGRLVYYKGFEYLIRAMREVDGHLLIVGEGPLHADLEREASVHGVERKVSFLGSVADVAPYYHASDVFALSSSMRSEAFGMVQIEAMTCGVPVVNTRLRSGVPFVSLDKVTGLTVPPGNPRALADAINSLLSDPRRRAVMGAAGKRRVAQEFSLEVMTQRTLAVYSQVMDGVWQPEPLTNKLARAGKRAVGASKGVSAAL
jgi:glycosyltransferase involved in cell wall biosynthesis